MGRCCWPVAGRRGGRGRLARAGAFVEGHPDLGQVWAAGVITSEHVHALARHADRLEPEQMAAVITELSPWWGQLSPVAVAAFVARVIRVLNPPPDPEPDEAAAHEGRSLSFALTADSVVLSGVLPRLEGEAVIAAIDAFAERLRSQADHVPASARRADGLVALVNAAHASGSIPTRGGLPVTVSVTLESTALGDQVWTTSRGHTLTDAETRFTSCDALVTPIVIDTGRCPDTVADLLAAAGPVAATAQGSDTGRSPTRWVAPEPSAAARITALATTLLGTRIPLAVGRTARTATPAQRRALAARDKGCIIPGCGIPAEACQTHHVQDWSAGGDTDLPNLALLCWAHHRQVDLGMWTIVAARPRTRYPDPNPAPHPEPPGPPTTAHPGPSPEPPEPAGGCEGSVASVHDPQGCRARGTNDHVQRFLGGGLRSRRHLEGVVGRPDGDHSCRHVLLGEADGNLPWGPQAVAGSLKDDAGHGPRGLDQLREPGRRRTRDGRAPGRVQGERQEQQSSGLDLADGATGHSRPGAAAPHHQALGADPAGAQVPKARDPRSVQGARRAAQSPALDPPRLLDQDHLDPILRKGLRNRHQIDRVHSPTDAVAKHQRCPWPAVRDRMEVRPREPRGRVDVPGRGHDSSSDAGSAGMGASRSTELLRTELTAVLTG